MNPTVPTPVTLGVEEELLVVDAVDGQLVPRAQMLLEAPRPEMRDRLQGELNRCQIEVASPVCQTLAEVESALREQRTQLATAAESVGCAVLPTGTHPFSVWSKQSVRQEVPRYAAMEERYRLVADEQIICGLHVHVGLGSREADVVAMRRLRPWLPVLLALSANSPSWEGRDSGYASFRSEVWRRWPTAGFPPLIQDVAAYDLIIEELVAADVLPDPSYLYWYTRPSMDHPTLECRAFDVPLRLQDTVTLAGLYRGLVWTLVTQGADDGPRHHRDLLDAAMWRAARYGLEGDLLDPRTRRPAPAHVVVAALLEQARPGLEEHGDRKRVEAGVQRILDEGTGAEVQRRAIAGGADGAALVAALRRTAGT